MEEELKIIKELQYKISMIEKLVGENYVSLEWCIQNVLQIDDDSWKTKESTT